MKRAMLVTVALLMAVGSVIALVNRELILCGVFSLPAALVFWLAVWGKSAAIKRAANVVEHAAFTLHVPDRSPKHPESKSGESSPDRDNEDLR